MASASPVPIAFCITELEFGGAERMLVELATRLDRTRFAPAVYSLAARPRPGRDQLPQRLEASGIEVHFLGGESIVHVPRVIRTLTGMLRAQRPAILQTFLWHANTLGIFAGRRAGVEHLLTSIRVAERRRNLRGWAARRTSHLVERHVCVSRAVAHFAAREMHLPAERLVVIPNGVDLTQFPAPPLDLTTLGLAAGRRALLFVGRLSPQKRPDWLIDQLSTLLAQLPEHNLLIVGRGRQRAALEAQAAALDIAARVHFLGWRSDVAALLAASDLLLLPSAAEGMPNVVLEAMASHKPVVATDVEGILELLGEQAGPQVVARDDAASFVRQAVLLASDAALAAALGGQNRARAAEKFSLLSMVQSYEHLYASLLR